MLTRLLAKFNHLLVHATTHTWLGVLIMVVLTFLIFAGHWIEKAFANPHGGTVKIRFIDTLNHVPSIVPYVDGKPATLDPEGSVEVSKNSHMKIKAYISPTGKLAKLKTGKVEKRPVLELNLENTSDLTITVSEE